MNAEIVKLRPESPMGIVRARETIRHPDLHSDAVVLDACETLIAWGDWIDRSRAEELRKAIVREAVVEINARARRERLIQRIVFGAAIFALGIFIGHYL